MRANQFIVHILSYIRGYASWSVGSGDSRLRERRGYRRGRRSVWGGAAGSGFRRSAGTFDGKPRGRETEPSDCLRGRAVSSSHLKAVWTGFVRVVSKVFFRSSIRVSSSRFKAVRTGFVRVVLKKIFSKFLSCFALSPYKWRGVDLGSTCSNKICGRDE